MDRISVPVNRMRDPVRGRAGHVRAPGAGAETGDQDEMLISSSLSVYDYNPLQR